MPKQNTKPSDYPQAVIKQIELLAQNIGIARKRRHETQAQWAKKLGVSQPTMARIERGDPSVAMASYVMCMWLINQASGLADLIAPQNDHASLEREVTKARSRGASSATASPPHLGVSPAATNHATTVAGLAALLAKAEPKSK
ncbi:helix-turn-helix transcriptional regulator [Rhodoferax sp.]|uniref:helix-turn-helix transcriptional regulator n=1 Tax=Rhodoferax sp. TaxID=50421 RepID=UPI0027159B52|nr:XRE family transcriptional regulator [Rhodoferax sp.]MDO9196551.1 XRE family transcriptional regulator [Rhodoferax sp.]